MGVATLAPESYSQTYEWMTDVLVARDGDEQRIAIRQVPRQKFQLSYLADNYEEIQSWRYQFLRDLDTVWALPIWPEAERITAAVVASTSTVDADFSLMDDGFTLLILMHPDGETYDIFSPTSRTATTATKVSTFADNYPIGSYIAPVQYSFVNNHSGYQAAPVNVATLDVEFTSREYVIVTGKGAPTLSMYRGFPVLDKRPAVSSDVFDEELDWIDYGHKIRVMGDPGQDFARITSGRAYLSQGRLDRQWWKLFLITIKGQQKPFYTSTYRPDMTLAVQPVAGASSIVVLDDATVAGGWVNSLAHQDLSLALSDGTTQHVRVTGAVNNGNGTHTVSFTPVLTSAPIDTVSFLEMVRLASDAVTIDHFSQYRDVKLSVRTLNEENLTL